MLFYDVFRSGSVPVSLSVSLAVSVSAYFLLLSVSLSVSASAPFYYLWFCPFKSPNRKITSNFDIVKPNRP